MSDRIEVDFKLKSADVAQLQIEDFLGALTRTERAVLELARADEKAGEQLQNLEEDVRAGRVGLDQYRAVLSQITAQAPRTAAELAHIADEQRKATEATERGRVGVVEFGRQAGEAYTYIVGAASDAIGRINSFATRVAELSSEQRRLTQQSARLGVDFDQAAAAAGRFADETEALDAATRLSAAGVHLSQEQLDALMRTAGSFSEQTGGTTADAVRQLTQGLLTGSQEGLRPFGQALADVAGEGHTVEERLAALVEHARTVPPAMDSASDSLARFKDELEDGARSMATGFTNELERLERESREKLGSAADSAQSFSTSLREVGAMAATTFARIYTTVNLVTEGIAHQVYTLGQLYSAFHRIAASPTQAGDIVSEANANIAASNARVQAALTRTRVAFGAGGTGADNMDPGSVSAANDNAGASGGAGGAGDGRRSPFGQGGFEIEDTGAGAGVGRVRGNAPSGGRGGARRGVDMTFSADEAAGVNVREGVRDELAFLFGGQRRPDWRANADEDGRSAEQRQRAEAFGRRQGGAPGDALADRAERDASERTRRNIDEQYELQRSYTDRMEELHGRRANAAKLEAAAVTDATQAMGEAIGRHVNLVVQDRETAGEAAQAAVADTLMSIGQQAVVKGAMEIAEGIAALAGIYTIPLAPGHFAAGAAFMGVGAMAGIAGAALAPSAPSASAAASAKPPALPMGVGSGGHNGSGDGNTNITINLGGGGVVMGTSRQLGEALGRAINGANNGVSINASRLRSAA